MLVGFGIQLATVSRSGSAKKRCTEIVRSLRASSSQQTVASMAKFGINTKNAYGISAPVLKRIAKEIGFDHSLAQLLWSTSIHEARMLACMIDDPGKVSAKQMEKWAKAFDSWDICDTCCWRLFDKTRFAYQKAVQWSKREEEFVKRAGFALMAALAAHDDEASDGEFSKFLSVIRREATDGRNFVKKGVNWALRQIGKRNHNLNRMAIETAKKIKKMDSGIARWIASDALRELKGSSVQSWVRSQTI